MTCGCDRLIVLNPNVDISLLSADGHVYLDLYPDTTFDQVDSITELDPLGNFKTNTTIGGSVPATPKNKIILGPLLNPRDQSRRLLRVVAANGHKILNVNMLRIVFYDEESFEIELLRDQTHWAVCAADLHLNTLDLGTYDFTKELIKDTWNNPKYEEGDLGIYFPLAYFGKTTREEEWVVEDFRPAHSIQMLLEKGFAQCGWTFSSPIFDETALWMFALGNNYGKDPDILEAGKATMKSIQMGSNIENTFSGDGMTLSPLISKLEQTPDGLISRIGGAYSEYVGVVRYTVRLDVAQNPEYDRYRTTFIFRIKRIWRDDNGDYQTGIVTELSMPYGVFEEENFQSYDTYIEWEGEIALAPGDKLAMEFLYTEGRSTTEKHVTELDVKYWYRMSIDAQPVLREHQRGDTVDIATIIDEDLTLLDLLKGVAHLFGQAKLYIDHAEKEMILLPPHSTTWENQTIEGFYKYDEVLNITDPIIEGSLSYSDAKNNTSRRHKIGYKPGRLVSDDYGYRFVDFKNDFEDTETLWENPIFHSVENRKLIKTPQPRTPISPEQMSDGIDLMYFSDSPTHDIPITPFIAYAAGGFFGFYGEYVGTDFYYYSFVFEGKQENIPIAGQKPNGVFFSSSGATSPSPILLYGEYPLQDLFSVFWREHFYKELLSSTVNITVGISLLKDLDYRKLIYLQYKDGLAAWLDQREYNHCSTQSVELSLLPDLTIEPECIDPDTTPPITPPCGKINSPEIMWEIIDCKVSYELGGTIESNITSDEWLIRYEDEEMFSEAPASPFTPEGNFYIRYRANTDDEGCSIPTRTEFVNICLDASLEAVASYNELDDCYRISVNTEGCVTFTEIQFFQDEQELTVENPNDPAEEWFVDICEPLEDFCVEVVGTTQEGCDVASDSICITICPTDDDIVCHFTEVEGGFTFNPDLSYIYREIEEVIMEYDLDSNFSDPVQIEPTDIITEVGVIHFRVTVSFTSECADIVHVCEYIRRTTDCDLNTGDFKCVETELGITFERTGSLVTPTLVDIIRYKKPHQIEWRSWTGESLAECPYHVQRVVIFCNDCPNICTEPRLCSCDGDEPVPIGCEGFGVTLRRFEDTLYAETTYGGSEVMFSFLEDGELVQHSTDNSYPLTPGAEHEYVVKATLGECEVHDYFLYKRGCELPEIELDDETNEGTEYTITFDIINPGLDTTFVVNNEYQIAEGETAVEGVDFVYSDGVLTIQDEFHYGENHLTIIVDTSCGSASIEHTIDIPCPTSDAGEDRYYTICEGCWGSVEAIKLLGGDPVEGGIWIDMNESGKLDGDSILFDELPEGQYEFMYVIDLGSPICNPSASVFVQVLREKDAGENTATTICHDEAEISLRSLLEGSPEEGGTWVTSDTIDGDLDLEEGTITPAATDIGKTVNLVYSFDPPVSTVEIEPGVVLSCDCLSFATLSIGIIDCTPPPPCPDDSDLGLTIQEVTNNNPEDSDWEDMLTVSKTGTYEDSSIIESDEIYFSYDDGDTWILGDEVKDDDYYEQLRFGFSFGPTSSFDPSPPHYQWDNIRLSSGDDIDMVRLTSGEGTFNILHNDFTSGDNVRAQGSTYDINRQRSFHLQVRHTLNSGWVMQGHYYLFSRVPEDSNGVGGPNSPLVRTHIRNKVSGKRRILFERRIEYNNGCEPIIVEGSFDPDVPECISLPANVGMNVTDPQGGFEGQVTCVGTVPGQVSSQIWQIEYNESSGLYNTYTWACGNPGPFDGLISLNHRYWMVRIIDMGDYCPPFFIERNYQAPRSCNVVGQIQCRKDDEARVAWASRINNPQIISFDTLQYRFGNGSWMSYSENQMIYVGDGAETVQFRRISNYNNGCPQTTESCSVSFSGVPQPRLSISCGLNNQYLNINASNLPPGGMYRIYRNGVLIRTQSNTYMVSLDRSGSYQVIYDYTYESNIVQCGEDPSDCFPPTVSIGSCTQVGEDLRVSFTTANISSSNQVQVTVSPNVGTWSWNNGSGTVTIPAQVGTVYNISVQVSNECGSDSSSTSCQIGCIGLSIQNIQCDFANNRTSYEIVTSESTSTRPSSNGTFLSRTGNTYRFRLDGTSGTITADHPRACAATSRTINCDCPTPSASIDIVCEAGRVDYSFTISNEQSVSGNYRILLGQVSTTIQNTGAGTYTGYLNTNASSLPYSLIFDACGREERYDGVVNCSCNDPSISLTASCSGTTVSYSFTVTREEQTNGNYDVYMGNTRITTINNTGAGTYSGTASVSPNSSNSIFIEVGSKCGGTVKSNTRTANCSCPPSHLYLSGVTCNTNNQQLSFNVEQSNVTNVELRVNGSLVTIGSNPQIVQGTTGSNTITLSGVDTCSGDPLDDSRTVNCSCDDPSLTLSASCGNNGVVSYTLSVGNPSRADGNFSLYVNNTKVETITNTDSSTYTGTYSGTAGQSYTLQAEVESKCGGIIRSNSRTVSCPCPPSSLSIDNFSCDNLNLAFNINSTNVSNRVLTVNGVTHSITSNPQQVAGQPGANIIKVTGEDSCSGDPLMDEVTLNCGCADPVIALSASCNSSGTVNYSFTVNNRENVDGSFAVVVNGTQVSTITNTNSSSYSGTYSGSPGNSYSVKIEADSKCGGRASSNTVNTNCSCPPSTLALQNVSCNPSNQKITLTVSRSNVENVELKLNGSVVSSNPSGQMTIDGVVGNNHLSLTGKDSCSGDSLSDSFTTNCACGNVPVVTISNIVESGSALQVNFSVTHVTSSSGIVVRANGVNISKSNVGGNNWRATFPPLVGNNTVVITAENECGSDSDTKSYNYSSCVDPTISLISQSINSAGNLVVSFITSNCSSISSSPSAISNLTCSSSQATFAYTGGTLTWSITVTNSCGSATLSRTFDPCQNCTVHISDSPFGTRAATPADCKLYLIANNCGNIAVNWTASGGGQITPTSDPTVIETNCEGTYEVGVTDQNNCFHTTSFTYFRPTSMGGFVPVKSKKSLPQTQTVAKTPSEYDYDYSQLTEEDNQELLQLYQEERWGKVHAFYNQKVPSDYFFSCSCDNEELAKIVKAYLNEVGLL